MFKLFKEKLRGALSKFTKGVKKEVEEKTEKEKVKSKPKKETVEKKPKSKKKEIKPEKPKEEKVEVKEEPKEGFFKKIFKKKEEPEEEKKGIFKRVTEAVTKTSISEDKFESLFWELEVTLLENNLAVAVIEKIKDDLKEQLVNQKISRFEIEKIILDTLKNSLNDILTFKKIDLLKETEKKKPFVICFVGINGSGKTTTIAKIANLFLKNNQKIVLAAADTFRAAAIQQLEQHADKLGVKMIKHDYGADAAAVAFDAIKYAEAKKLDAVLIDTAGRLHSNVNLMEEMSKIMRIANPDFKIFVGESITGNDCVEQAEEFNKAVELDGIVLSKADIDEKGGAAISVSYVTKKPILYIGTGQEYDDIKPFDKKEILKTLGL
ncbi:signal recognition particle-docking protein FtsY [Nanoarchaeota archaeon]